MTKKETYLVEGMTCSGCERTVQKVLKNLRALRHQKPIFHLLQSLSNMIHQKSVFDNIKSAVNNVGYKFVGERPSNGKREGSDEAVS